MNTPPKKSSKKRVYYSRVSTIEQNDERQIQNVDGYDYVLRDKCSGLIPFFDRPNGKQLKKLIENNELHELAIHSIDRLGRSTIDVLTVWKDLTEMGITIICKNPNIRNFNEDGKPDKFSELTLSIVSIMSTFEKNMIRERQLEGIAIRKAKNLYNGRPINTKETPEKFLSKPKIKKILAKVEDGYSHQDIVKIVGCSYSTIGKAIKLSTANTK